MLGTESGCVLGLFWRVSSEDSFEYSFRWSMSELSLAIVDERRFVYVLKVSCEAFLSFRFRLPDLARDNGFSAWSCSSGRLVSLELFVARRSSSLVI